MKDKTSNLIEEDFDLDEDGDDDLDFSALKLDDEE